MGFGAGAVGVESSAATISSLTVAAGPWQFINARGQTCVGVRLIPSVDLVALRAVRPHLGKVVFPVTPDVRIVPGQAGALAGQVVATWTMPLLTSGRFTLGADARSPQVDIPLPPSASDPVRVAVIGGQDWPMAADLADLAKPLGGPPSLVVVLGRIAAGRLGTGAWESSTPCLLRLQAGEGDPLRAAILGELPSAAADATWGLLGLPSLARGPEVAVDCAARPRPWNILLDPDARWDLGLRADPARADVQALRLPVGMARLLQVPLILGGGTAAGFISEPLTTADTGVLRASAGGVRYVAGTPAGDGVRALPPLAAMAITELAWTGIQVDASTLRLVMGPDIELRWQVGNDATGNGWGRGDGVKLAEAYRAGLTAKPPAEIPAELVWLPRSQLALGEWNLLELFTLARPESGEPSLVARRLACRLVSDPQFIGDEPALLRKMPEWLQREAILRWMAVDDPTATAWIELAARSPDPLILRALLAQAEREHVPLILGVLTQRLAAQAAGTLPVDEDPIIQSRLASAVFDAPTLSPTPLRPIARQLLPRLSPLGAKPVARFLERVGLYRSAE